MGLPAPWLGHTVGPIAPSTPGLQQFLLSPSPCLLPQDRTLSARAHAEPCRLSIYFSVLLQSPPFQNPLSVSYFPSMGFTQPPYWSYVVLCFFSLMKMCLPPRSPHVSNSSSQSITPKCSPREKMRPAGVCRHM